MTEDTTTSTTTAAQDTFLLSRDLIAYCQPSNWRAISEIFITILPLVGLWLLMWLSLEISYWLTLLLAIRAAALLTRLFMIQHDCGHGSFFRHRRINDWTGRVIGVLTLTPYLLWKRTHAIHHANSGNLDRRGIGDIETLTVTEYRERSALGKFLYRVYRHPLVLFGLGPAYLFILQHRLPVGLMRRGWKPWLSVMGTNLAIVLAFVLLAWTVGIGNAILVHVPIVLIAASLGVWLFFVQHQFEQTTWERSANWKWADAAFHGSSYYDLPAFQRWLTGNIGVHHVHHLNSRIPFYRLPQVLSDYPELRNVNRITIRDSLRCIPLSLWDENKRRLIRFADAD